jgi:hypothetical protein
VCRSQSALGVSAADDARHPDEDGGRAGANFTDSAGGERGGECWRSARGPKGAARPAARRVTHKHRITFRATRACKPQPMTTASKIKDWHGRFLRELDEKGMTTVMKTATR